jgi:hypothetical protein
MNNSRRAFIKKSALAMAGTSVYRILYFHATLLKEKKKK